MPGENLLRFIVRLLVRETEQPQGEEVSGEQVIFVERLWRTVKYEEVYLRACASISSRTGAAGRSFI